MLNLWHLIFVLFLINILGTASSSAQDKNIELSVHEILKLIETNKNYSLAESNSDLSIAIVASFSSSIIVGYPKCVSTLFVMMT